MVHMTMKVERHLKLKGNSKFGAATNLNSSSSWKSSWSKKDDKLAAKPKDESHKSKKSTSNKEKGIESQPKLNRDIKYFRCLVTSHITSQCPNKIAMILRGDGEIETKGEDE